MRIFDLLKLAAKTLKGRWAALPVAGITIGMFCLCFAGAVIAKVQQEKSLPCELNVASGTVKLSDASIAEISKIAGVTAVTPLLTIPVTVKTGDYSAELTLTGITPEYLNDKFSAGNIFPNSSVMPYIVLNDAACKKFSNGNEDIWDETEDKEPDIDWLSDEFTVSLDESKKPVIAKVCGILSGNEEGQQPLAYISISCAKDLLQGEGAVYTSADVRIKNTGFSESVTKAIGALGLEVSNANEKLQQEWDIQTNEMAYLLVTGVFSLLCAAVIMAAWRKIFLYENKEALRMLRWIGMKEKETGGIFMMQALTLSLTGIILGIIISVSLPSFLQSGQDEASIFTLPVPFIVILISVALSLLAGILPFLRTNHRY